MIEGRLLRASIPRWKIGRDAGRRRSDKVALPANGEAQGGSGRLREATMHTESQSSLLPRNVPWNKGRLTGQKRPLKPREVWAIRVRLQLQHRARDLALFNLAIDSKLRGCDLVRLQIDDVWAGGRVRERATIIQKKTGRPVQFEITEQTRAAIRAWLPEVEASGRHLFPSCPDQGGIPDHGNRATAI